MQHQAVICSSGFTCRDFSSLRIQALLSAYMRTSARATGSGKLVHHKMQSDHFDMTTRAPDPFAEALNGQDCVVESYALWLCMLQTMQSADGRY